MIKWAEITNLSGSSRAKLLSNALAEAGLENSVDTIQVSEYDFESAVRDAVEKYDQIRIFGSVCELVHKLEVFTVEASLSTPRFALPSAMVALKSADALIKEGETWKPHNFLADGFRACVVNDIKIIDTSGSVFIVGATCETRGVVATLARMGFQRFDISELNEERGRAFVGDLNQSYFGSSFQFVDRHLITQLPSVNTVAVNALQAGQDEGVLGELYYFNFLKPGGVWVDLSIQPRNKELEAEAKAVGAIVQNGARIAAWTDIEWARAVFKVELNRESYFASLESLGS